MLTALLLMLPSPNEPLLLTCIGKKVGNSSAPIVRGQGAVNEEQIDVRLFTGDDRIRFPKVMLPVFHGNSGRWLKVRELAVEGAIVRATVKYNFANSETVEIDREQGIISIDDNGITARFRGTCRTVGSHPGWPPG